MFVGKTSHGRLESFNSRYRAGKSTASRGIKRSFQEHAAIEDASFSTENDRKVVSSAVVTICVGKDQRLFAAHENVLCISPFFAAQCRCQSHLNNHIMLPDEQPEVFSSVLEYLYKDDYYPRLLHDKHHGTWSLEGSMMDLDVGDADTAAVIHQSDGTVILKDTAMYCAAERYQLPGLKRLALRKQGFQSGIHCSTILASARYAYANTPDNDSQLRAHYLALIIRSRSTFKRSGTMQMEMEKGGKLFFDLFVAMCNHMDDLSTSSAAPDWES